MNKKTKTLLVSLTLLSMVLGGLVGVFQWKDAIAGYLSIDQQSIPQSTYRTYDFFASSTIGSVPTDTSTSTTALSTSILAYFDNEGRYDQGWVDIRGAKKISVIVATNGSGKFDFDVTPNGTDWFNFNKLKGSDVSSTGTSTITTGPNNGGATTTAVLDITDEAWYGLRCNVTEIADGNHECKAVIEY